jgi:pyruvate formate lyase activating enzyme
VNIGGFQKNSLIDFPGTVACVIYTSGCNFTCPYCHNPELAAGPVKGTGSHDLQEILAFIQSRKGLVDGVVITGGEPCLHADLADVIQRIRDKGAAVKLDTNGSRPEILADLLNRSLVDYVAMDIKTGPDRYPDLMTGNLSVNTIQNSIHLIMDQAPAYEFRTTCVRPFINDEIMKQISTWIRGAQQAVLQRCSSHVPMLDPHFSSHTDRFFSDQEIQALQAILRETVHRVRVR